jgi:uncharacterized membrane protein
LPASPQRVGSIDSLRGLAILAMIAYHFAYDLRHFGVIRADFEGGAFWLGARATILSSFLLLVGVSLVLAAQARVTTARFVRRIAVVTACAMAVTVGSYLMFPQRFIYFGTLHCIAASALLARPFVGRPRLALAVGIAVIVAGNVLGHPFFDARATSWVGFNTVKPPTEDFVPLFPWMGVVLVGVALGRALLARPLRPRAGRSAGPSALAWLGRHSLAIYMVHQPLLIGLLWLILRR